MSEFDNTPLTPPVSQPSGPAGWLPVWIKAVTQPKEQTFVDITEHPDANMKTAFIWVFIAGTISGIIQAFSAAITTATGVGSPFQQIPGMEQYFPQSTGGGGGVGAALIGGLCASPLAGLFSILFFALFVAIIQWIAKLFGGTGTFEKLAYAFAAITVPYTIVSSLFALLSAIPFVGICAGVIAFGLWIYYLVLLVIATKSVNRFGWGQATGSVFIPGCTAIILCVCIVVAGLAVLGPVVGNVFSEINQSLQTVP
jgi:hypothetical protein